MRRGRAGLGIRAKLFLVFLTLVLAPFAVYTAITFQQSARNAERSGRYAARQVLRQAGQFVEARVGLVRRALQSVALDPDVRAACAADPSSFRGDLGRWVADAGRIRRTLLAVQRTEPDLSGFTLYMARGLAAYSESPDLRSLDGQRGERWLERARSADRSVLWLAGSFFPGAEGERFVHAVARIPDDMDLRQTAGYVRADLPARVLSDILDQAKFSEGSSAVLLDARSAPIASSRRVAGPDGALIAAAAAAFDPSPDLEPVARTIDVRGRRYLADGFHVRGTDWRLVLLVPYEDIDAFGKGVRRDMGVALAVLVPLLVPLAFAMAATSTRRIARLARGVRELERGNLALDLPVTPRDEIGELGRELNGMAARIRDLLAEQYRLGQEMQRHELTALQAQINPHFLYNTLELVNCLALREDVSRIAAAVEALSGFYRLSLSGGAERVTVQQELEHAELYLRIQNMRFDDGITLVVEVPPEVRARPLLKIVLQPLVENAVLHGIREKESGRGTVTIRGRLEAAGEGSAGGGDLVLEVEDDGVGMSPAALGALASGAPSAGEHGYGLRNIDRRLRVAYGGASGLSFRSAPGAGTTVVVRASSHSSAQSWLGGRGGGVPLVRSG